MKILKLLKYLFLEFCKGVGIVLIGTILLVGGLISGSYLMGVLCLSWWVNPSWFFDQKLVELGISFYNPLWSIPGFIALFLGMILWVVTEQLINFAHHIKELWLTL